MYLMLMQRRSCAPVCDLVNPVEGLQLLFQKRVQLGGLWELLVIPVRYYEQYN
jgi:hypothetical protein